MSSQNSLKPKVTRNHPPRLQHSPSLPNIWFPPHSGPIPPQFQGITRESLQRPSTPPFPMALQPGEPQALPEDHELLENHAAPSCQARPKKIQTHRRVDRDHNHSHPLLTPPLTPSSSLRTATSVETSESTEIDTKDDGNHNVDNSTRFLLLGNVSKQIRYDILKSSIIRALSSQSETSNINSIFESPIDATRFTGDSIKGFFLRLQQTDGVVILAFFDSRHAKIAAQIIARPSENLLTQCVGDDVAEDGTKSWITCRFVSAEELEKITGKSSFIASINASFYLTVENRYTTDGTESKDRGAAMPDFVAEDGEVDLASNTTGGLDIGKLGSFLNSFGSLRIFTEANETLSGQPVFQVEYHDVRDADLAYSTLHGQTLFGMKLNVFGREDIPDKTGGQSYSQPQEGVSPTKDIPRSHSTNPAEFYFQPAANIGPPGQYSRTREWYLHPEETQPHLHNTFLDHNHQSPAPSPPYFYTSNAAQHPVSVRLCHPSERRDSGEIPYVNDPRAQTPSCGRPIESAGGWTGDLLLHSAYPPGLYQHDYYHYPSRTNTISGAYECYGPCSIPSPFCYQPNQPLQSTPFLPMYPPTHAYAQEVDNSYPQPTYVTAPAALSSENPLPDVVQRARPALHNMPYTPPKKGASAMDQSNGGYAKLGSTSLHAPRATRLVHSQGGTREPRTIVEHNQLNIGRIEDGQDTRTTVMIKNIPNKMSDKDLIAYIGDVCPRRIDFLYLRMDFTNGCNVGYAFVNFILVQDLLTFAKKKLGEKWNMFSSEKVLQMSYATYQGKEALVEKFKNSCIMDVQESWRPKIFYSEPGPEQGLPEPFPAPTHMRRKERSAMNRGALFVPGILAQAGSSGSRRR